MRTCLRLRENAYAVDLADTGESSEMASETQYNRILLDATPAWWSQVCRELRESRLIRLSDAHRSQPRRTARGRTGCRSGRHPKETICGRGTPSRACAPVRRRSSKSRSTVRCADLELDSQRRRVTRSGRPITLTSKEFALLEFLMSRAPEVAPRTEIIEHVWDSNFDSETNLVEVYINRLRPKLSAEGTPRIIHTVHGVGYCLKATE